MENNKTSAEKINNSINDKNNSDENTNSTNIIQKNVKSQSIKKKNKLNKNEIKSETKNNDDEDVAIPARTIKRNNSIKLYKKHKKEQEKRNSIKRENKNGKDSKDKTGDIFDVVEKDETKKKNNNKSGKQKKVFFPPDFVTIIDVESYKKFNEENTCKDPFDNLDLLNANININTKNNQDEPDGKARVLCSCLIF